MKKALKTLINTSMLMLFFSHSYGLALVYNLDDVDSLDGSSGGSPNGSSILVFDDTTHPGFSGIDDTFDGTVTFNFTITYKTEPIANQSFALFTIMQPFAGTLIEIGNDKSTYWNGTFQGGVGEALTFGSNSVVKDTPQSFTMTVDYNPGANNDTATIQLAGDSTVYSLRNFDYSFGSIEFFVDSGTTASATNMSVSIVPEPATYALLSGALALVFVALRRRFKA